MINRRKYTKEFKEEAARLVIEQGYSQAAASKSLGVPAKNLNRWVKNTKGVPVKKSVSNPESSELARLKKENHQL